MVFVVILVLAVATCSCEYLPATNGQVVKVEKAGITRVKALKENLEVELDISLNDIDEELQATSPFKKLIGMDWSSVAMTILGGGGLGGLAQILRQSGKMGRMELKARDFARMSPEEAEKKIINDDDFRSING